MRYRKNIKAFCAAAKLVYERAGLTSTHWSDPDQKKFFYQVVPQILDGDDRIVLFRCGLNLRRKPSYMKEPLDIAAALHHFALNTLPVLRNTFSCDEANDLAETFEIVGGRLAYLSEKVRAWHHAHCRLCLVRTPRLVAEATFFGFGKFPPS